MSRLRTVFTRPFRLGIAVFAAFVLVLTTLVFKPQLENLFSSGTKMQAEFGTQYKLRPYDSSVKIAGLVVGDVTDVSATDHGTVLVTMKLDDKVLDILGSKPSASIEPRTVLGGRYTVDLHPGGEPGRYAGGAIPLDRTRIPVEADRVLEALPTDTLHSVQKVVADLDQTLRQGGQQSLGGLVHDAPSVLGPGADVLQAARGTRPGTDLPQIVQGLSNVANTLTAKDGQLDSIVVSLNNTARTLAGQSGPLTDAVSSLPGTLRDTRAGLTGLSGTLDRLTSTAPALHPTVDQLGPLVQKLNPVLRQAVPVLDDLQPLLRDAQPAVQELNPVAQQATDVLQTVRGPVLDRVNGPVTHLLLNTWHGTGPYAQSGGGNQADHKFYEELAYMATNIDRASMTQDQHGSLLSFQVGAGTGSVAGIPFNLENLMAQITHAAGGGSQ
ncbi:hypothetical protein HFP15_15185 [Amycolatopsis sp. K13G38]|uniref:Mce/MlaD domain-containing protein n=1 Tax=Amycolatopsis acididurans TaxID=2724524 RepID=A0ABX1J377_9PSEU|nr:MlaD family protein [Amycolatopsis acididurans]NKQ54231.1 hypothetical protein [Amycolatopsis acididurans]